MQIPINTYLDKLNEQGLIYGIKSWEIKKTKLPRKLKKKYKKQRTIALTTYMELQQSIDHCNISITIPKEEDTKCTKNGQNNN